MAVAKYPPVLRRLILSCLLMVLSGTGGVVAQGGGTAAQLEAITGRHTRLVWAGLAKPGVSDPDSISQQQQLFGFDSRDGRGLRKISPLDGNFSRPLLTPTGERVVYSRWDARTGQSHVHVAKFGGGLHSLLASGFAIDILKLEDSPKIWIYALDSMRWLQDGTRVAGQLVRFAIDQPGKVEVVYEGEAVVMGSVSMSRNGSTMLALRPDRGIGHFDIASGIWSEPGVDGGGGYAFDVPGGLSPPLVDLGLAVAAGVEARDVRVSRQPSIVVFSARSKPEVPGSEEIHVAGLSGKGEAVRELVAITGRPAHADQMPDIWLGEAAEQPGERGGEVAGAFVKWPVVEAKGSLFWENSSESAARTIEFRILGKGRYGRGFVMTPEGGAVVPSQDSQRKIEAIVDPGGRFSMEFLLRGHANPGAQVLFYSAGLVVVEEGGKLYAMAKDWGTGLWSMADYCVCDARSRPRSVVYTREGQSENWFIDGEWASVKRASRPSSLRIDTRGLTTYFSGWMELSRIGFHPRVLEGEEIRAIARSARDKTNDWRPAPYREVEATLLEVTGLPERPESGDSGRLLVDHWYRIEAVGKGDAGLSVGDEVSVSQWAVLGAAVLDGFPRKPGRRSFLALEPVEEHPELSLEKRVGDFADRGMPAFLAVNRRLSLLSPEGEPPPYRVAAERTSPEPRVAVVPAPVVSAPVVSAPAPVSVPPLEPPVVTAVAALPGPAQSTNALAEALPQPAPPPPLPPLLSAGGQAGAIGAASTPAPRYPRLVPTYPAPPPVSNDVSAAPAPSTFSISEVRSTMQQAAELMQGRRRNNQLEEAARMRDELLRNWKAGQ